MRRFFTFILLVCIGACKRPEPIRLQPTIEEESPLSSAVILSDPASSRQLLSGFSALEQGAWRWTTNHFSVVLATPATARTNGAWLVLKFVFPDASLDALKDITVSCKVGDVVLPPETFRTAGEHEYRREVPASAFTPDSVVADFSLDKTLKPPGDGRELGVVATGISLDAK